MHFNQGEFNFQAEKGESGYQHWLEELDTQKKSIESRWGIVIGKKVRVHLQGYAHPTEGTITLPTLKPKPGTPPELRIGNRVFSPTDIVSITRLDDANS